VKSRMSDPRVYSELLKSAPILGYIPGLQKHGKRVHILPSKIRGRRRREKIEGLDGEANVAIAGKQSVHHASDDLQEIGKICNQCRQISP
jgi:hypothetical protein